MSQKLSPKAKKAKARRDLASANTPARERKRAQNQRIRRKAKKQGKDLTNKDIHHTANGGTSIVSTHQNRGNYGKGTKTEGLRPRKHNID